ncbi:nucleotide sugar dehydrogenase [Amycolatopsis thermalba]|uniref:Nucleotide sugar dehydrogenase n=1 Tax=Amycolatopsis thermalba TaxID=944492 RepID=A0ABY4NXD7_9PSEU|nr:nucleotide sugar dehydrogenase [Amycolatopsis thermalba]UQS24744.1 nucleotide sugar dehydrogenase [Amycolatopsis thermalba]
MSRRVDLAVVGVGYTGLPLLWQAHTAGLSTAGFDTDPAVVARLNAGRSHVPDVSDAAVRALRAAGFRASADPRILADADVVVICVPTGLDGDGGPDLGAVRAAAGTVAARLRPGMLVVLESTTRPGTTEELVRPVLEQRSGLVAGEDFHLGYSPERVDPGNPRFGIGNTPKIVSGCTPLCAKHCATFYGRFVDEVVVAKGTREAELAKLLENTYRYVNIALVNEFARYCAGIGVDVWDVIHCAGTKPFGFASFTPGPGVGGHCIPVDPVYLAERAAADGFTFGVLAAAQRANRMMPGYVADRARAMLAERGVPVRGARVLLLGVAYKPDVPDTRESPAAPLVRRLRDHGAVVSYHDPLVPAYAVDGVGVPRARDLPGALAAADLAVLLQDHRAYRPAMLARHARLLLDTRGKVAGERVRRL